MKPKELNKVINTVQTALREEISPPTPRQQIQNRYHLFRLGINKRTQLIKETFFFQRKQDKEEGKDVNPEQLIEDVGTIIRLAYELKTVEITRRLPPEIYQRCDILLTRAASLLGRDLSRRK